MKVSVIVPVYGIENFIRRCAESLFSQTLKDGVEYIFVDDASTDRSIEILKDVLQKYPERKEQVSILTHRSNQGLPAARNTGLLHAHGEYVIHIDGDDYVENRMLEDLCAEAKAQDADIVWSDFYLTYEDSERYLDQPEYITSFDALRGMLRGEMKYNVWNKLVRRALYSNNNIHFPSGFGMGEDMTMIKLFCHASKVSYVPKAYYHYVKFNSQAFSQTYSSRHMIELKKNVEELSYYLADYLGNEYEELINFFKLEVKFPFLISDKSEKHEVWKNWYKESNAYVWKNPSVSFRRKLLQGMASLNQWWFVNFYFAAVYKTPFIRVFKH